MLHTTSPVCVSNDSASLDLEHGRVRWSAEKRVWCAARRVGVVHVTRGCAEAALCLERETFQRV